MTAPDPLDYAPLAWRARPFFDRPLALRSETAEIIAGDPGALAAFGGGDEDRRGAPYQVAQGAAWIPVHGALANRDSWLARAFGVISYDALGAAVRAAAADPSAKAIILDIDSPGGEAAGAMELAEVVREATKAKPVIAWANALAASAAYWIASGANEIVVTPTATVGSIGVVWLHIDRSAALAMDGLKPTLLHSGAYKIDGASTHPLERGAGTRIQAQLDDVYDLFTKSVGKHRPRLGAAGARATEAGVFMGEKAVAAGLADRVAASPLPPGGARALRTAAAARAASDAPAIASSPPSSASPARSARGDAEKPAARAPAVEAACKEAYDEGFRKETARIAAIMECEAAKARPKYARYIAFETRAPVDVAIEALGRGEVETAETARARRAPPPIPTYRSVAECNAAQARLGNHTCRVTGP